MIIAAESTTTTPAEQLAEARTRQEDVRAERNAALRRRDTTAAATASRALGQIHDEIASLEATLASRLQPSSPADLFNAWSSVQRRQSDLQNEHIRVSAELYTASAEKGALLEQLNAAEAAGDDARRGQLITRIAELSASADRAATRLETIRTERATLDVEEPLARERWRVASAQHAADVRRAPRP